jgi:branched-chain amino acid transport system ATP-binding protein
MREAEAKTEPTREINPRARRSARLAALTGGGALLPLLLLFGLNAADELDRAAFATLLPEIRDWFGVSLTAVLAAGSISTLFGVLFIIPIGYLADRVKRLRLVAAGAGTWALFSFLTGLAPNIPLLFAARFGSGASKTLEPAHSSLLADYYPPDTRGGVFATYRMADSVGRFLGPLIAGLLAGWFVWQVPFFLFAIPSLVLGALVLARLREPVRGEQERRALGADEEVALSEEKPPSAAESWRIASNVRTLRRLWLALPFLIGVIQVLPNVLTLYLDEVWGLGAGARGTLIALNEPFVIGGLIVGGIVSNRLIANRPGRVLAYAGGLTAVAAGSIALMAVAPVLPVAVGFGWAQAFAGAVLAPAVASVVTLVIPPRARGFALSVGAVFIIPGALLVPAIVGPIGAAHGMRVGLLAIAPILLIGAILLGTASSGVEPDIRQAQAAAMAAHAAAESRRKGKAKLLVCRDVDVHYDAVQVLFNVDFEVDEGEIIALLGTNGAGKSTLLRAISGVTAPSNGAIFFDGDDITYLPSSDHASRGIIQVPGGKGVFPTLSVRENLRLAAWLYRDEPKYVSEATERVFEFFPVLRDRLDQPAGNLSGGEQQMLTLGQAFLSRPTLLMIDELSLGLAPVVVEQLLRIVRAIHEQGTTIILVEQSVNVALTVAERAVFMEKGEIRFSGSTQELLHRSDILRSVYLKGSASSSSYRGARRAFGSAGAAPSEAGAPVLEVRGLRRSYGGIVAVDDVDLVLREGEILGLIGPNGAGKTTLFDLISGYTPADDGRILLYGEDVTDLGPDARAKLGLHRSFQDARLFPALTVEENIAVALEKQLEVKSATLAALRLPAVRKAEARLAERVDRLVQLMNLTGVRDKFVRELSTGSRRVVDLACVMAAEPKVLLLDEPSSGIAQRETEELGPLLQRIKYETGCSILIIEHDMPLITAISDELVALALGAVLTRGAPADVLEHEAVVASYLGTTEEVIQRSGSR